MPSYFLYGEPAREVDDGFLHLESLDERSRASEWNIRPHAHDMLHHIFFIEGGGGVLTAEGAEWTFVSPCLLLIPATTIHAFRMQPDVVGRVLTLSTRYIDGVLHESPAIADMFGDVESISLKSDRSSRTSVRNLFDRISQELTWHAPAGEVVLRACVASILVHVLRSRTPKESALHQTGRKRQTASRFLAELETTFRDNVPVAAYATRLGVSECSLRGAVLSSLGRPPARIIRDRLVLEAKRLLLYSNATVAECGYALGFDDPAYFSRFFRAASGQSPRAFRKSRSVPN